MKKQRHFLIQFLCVMAILLAITIQGLTSLIPVKPLFGYSKEEQVVPLTFKTLYDGSYQGYLTEYAKRHTGFREFLIRGYNQYLYSGFHIISNNNIQEGEDGELFLNMYLNEVTGQTLLNKFGSVEEAKAQARLHTQETVTLIDTLHRHGAHFLFVFAPTKTALYPEKMPQYYREHASEFCLEEYYIELFKEYSIPHIDLFHYFQSISDTSAYPLYTKAASHWSEYAVAMAADTILKKLGELTGYHLPTIQVVDMNVTTDYSDYDSDLEKSLNLLFPFHKQPQPRPIYTLSDTAGTDRPNLLVIGDSYFDQLMFSCFKDAFDQWDFWQYMLNVYSSNGLWKAPYSTVSDPLSVVKNADIILGINTAPMIYNYMADFPVKAVNMYGIQEEEIQKFIEHIRSIPEWYEGVVKQAEKLNISVEEDLRLNAIYCLENQANRNQ